MAAELTTVACEKVKTLDHRQEIPDGKVGGLRLVVQPSGRKSWAYRYAYRGRKRKFTIGAFPAIGLREARERAYRAKAAVADGRDPAAEKTAARVNPPSLLPIHDRVETAVERFLATHGEQHLKPTTAAAVRHTLEREVVTAWRGRRLSDIRRADIHSLLDPIVERGSPIAANRTLSWLKGLCAWAVKRGLIETSPCFGIKPPAGETSRDRVLDDAELAAIWRAADALRPVYGDYLHMLILTGARRAEIAQMEWAEINFEDWTFTLPKHRSKNNIECTFPLSNAAMEILARRLSDRSGPYVFTLPRAVGPISNFHALKQYLGAGLPPDMKPWRLHDLRRSFASGCARIGVQIHVVEKLLNHRSGSFRGVAGVYQRHDFAGEQRVASNLWAAHVMRTVSGETTANVLPWMRRP